MAGGVSKIELKANEIVHMLSEDQQTSLHSHSLAPRPETRSGITT